MTGQISGVSQAADLAYQLMKNKDLADDGLEGENLGGIDGTPGGGGDPPDPPAGKGGGKGNKRGRARP